MIKLLFRKKKLSFAKRDEKKSTHYSSYIVIFANMRSNWKYGEKSSLNSSKNRILQQLANAFSEKVFYKTIANLGMGKNLFFRFFNDKADIIVNRKEVSLIDQNSILSRGIEFQKSQ